MKTKISFLALIFSIVFITSCKKNDDNHPDDNGGSSSTNVSSMIPTGSWRVSYYHESADDRTVNFNGYTFTFNSNGTMTATNAAGTTNGTWRNDDSSNEFHMSIGNKSPLSDLNKGWLIITQTNTEFDLKDDNSTHNEEVHFTKI